LFQSLINGTNGRVVQRQEFRKHEVEKSYEEHFAEPSIKFPDVSNRKKSTGKRRMKSFVNKEDLLPPEKSFSVQ
jgi:hypothetical protein